VGYLISFLEKVQKGFAGRANDPQGKRDE